jgi:cytochrome c
MKKMIFSVVIIAGLVACGGGETKKADSAPAQPATSMVGDDLSSNPVYKKGVELVAKNQCLACHKVEEKLIGPAYKDVAAKYPNAADTTINRLAKKVVDGGSGVWGAVQMTPHPGLSIDDAKAMVNYVLMLKK